MRKERTLRNRLLHIVYHGTSEENTKKILKEGFKEYSYFAKNLADAISMGGPYVFGVVIEHKKAPEWFEHFRCWQIRNKELIPPSKIVSLRKYSSEDLLINKKLSKKVFERSLEYYNEIGRYGDLE